MNKIETPIKDLYILEPEVYGDHRGWFYESYNVNKFRKIGIETIFKQDNHSSSIAGVLRGLHFQLPPKPMIKLVRCTKGRLWDVAVDLRKKSDTYLKWFGVELSADNKKMLYIPAGFGHGFYALEDCEIVYKCSSTFEPKLDSGIAWNDPAINIEWPIDEDLELTLSDKDTKLPNLKEAKLTF